MNQLQWNLQNLNPNALHYLPSLSWYQFTWNTARICAYNNYVFENTHVSEWEMGWAIGYIASKCCTNSGNPQW